MDLESALWVTFAAGVALGVWVSYLTVLVLHSMGLVG